MKKYLLIIFMFCLLLPFTVNAMPVNIQPSDSDSFVLELESSDIIEAVKQKIYNFNNLYSVENQVLSFNDLVMIDGRSLSDYNVVEDSIIYLTMVEEFTVVFDANEGTFVNGNILTIDKWENGLEASLEIPTREGYKFLGFYTEKVGGTKLELILAESGIDSDMTFFAQWEEITEEVVPPVVEGEKNPETFDPVMLCINLMVISLIGFISLLIWGRKEFNNI